MLLIQFMFIFELKFAMFSTGPGPFNQCLVHVFSDRFYYALFAYFIVTRFRRFNVVEVFKIS